MSEKEMAQAAIDAEMRDSSWPQMKEIPQAPKVPSLPPEMLPTPLRLWIQDIADRACIPSEMVAAPVLVALSAVSGRNMGIRPGKYDDYLVVPNLWGAVIAPIGSLKSYAVEQATKPLLRLAQKAREIYKQKEVELGAKRERLEAEIDSIKKDMVKAAGGKDNPGLASLEQSLIAKRQEQLEAVINERRYVTQDATVEKLADLLKSNPRGVLQLRDELAGWLRSLDKPGREGDREFYLEAWNGTGSYMVDRIGRGSHFIPALTLAVVGGIQPGKLRSYIDQALVDGGGADGLLQRFQLLVWPDSIGEWTRPEGWSNKAARDEAYVIFEKIDQLTPEKAGATVEEGQIPYLRFSQEAQTLYDEWRDELERRLRGGSLESMPAFQGHIAKYRSLMPSLALLFHLVDVVSKGVSGPVSLSAAQLAASWCDYLEFHAKKVYAPEVFPGVDAAHALARKIREGQVQHRSLVSSLYREHHWKGLSTASDVSKALEVLEDSGWVRVESIPTNGRPSDVLRLHPELRGQR